MQIYQKANCIIFLFKISSSPTFFSNHPTFSIFSTYQIQQHARTGFFKTEIIKTKTLK